MEKTERVEKLYKFIRENHESVAVSKPKEFYMSLSEALYTCNESSIFGDMALDSSDIFIAYALVKTLLEKDFPEELKM